MKKKKSDLIFYIIVIILLGVLIFNRQITDIIGEFNSKNLPVSFNSYIPFSTYYYNRLNDTEKQAYICLFNGIKEHKKRIHIPELSEDELNNVFDSVKFDNPDIIWLGSKGYIVSFAGSEYFEPEYLMDSAESKICSNKLDKIVSEIQTETKGMSKYETELYIHDYITENCVYKSTEFDDNAYGCLVKGESVCSGYASAFMYILNRCGIECNVITGNAVDKDGNEVSHMWNIIKLESQYYFTDVTWDDVNSDSGYGCIHLFFNMNYKQLIKKHTPDFELKNLIYGDKYNYFVMNSMYYSVYDGTVLDSLIKNGIDAVNNSGYSLEFKFKNSSVYKTACGKLFSDSYNGDLAKIIYHINLRASRPVKPERISYVKNDDYNYIRITFIEND